MVTDNLDNKKYLFLITTVYSVVVKSQLTDTEIFHLLLLTLLRQLNVFVSLSLESNNIILVKAKQLRSVNRQ